MFIQLIVWKDCNNDCSFCSQRMVRDNLTHEDRGNRLIQAAEWIRNMPFNNDKFGLDVGTLYLYYPSSTSNYVYPPVLSVYNAGTREKQVKITVLEDSGNLTWKTDWGTTVSTTGRTSRYVSLSNASQVYYADNASTATAASYATSLNAPIVATLPTSSGVKFCTNLTILSKTDTWFIETYAYYPYKFQRATAMSDPSEVAVRTSTDNGTTWSNWVYSYSVWHT